MRDPVPPSYRRSWRPCTPAASGPICLQHRASYSTDERHTTLTTHRTDVVVIGAGQAGLAAGYHLQRRIDSLILEADARGRRGDVVRIAAAVLAGRSRRPARDAVSVPKQAFPSGHQMGDYLELYAATFGLPVKTGDQSSVSASWRRPALPGQGGNRRFEAAQVIVATGAFQRPRVPTSRPSWTRDPPTPFERLPNPSQLDEGPVLVVGPSHSGADSPTRPPRRIR